MRTLVISDAIFARVFPLHFPHVLAFFLSFRSASPSRLLVYSLYYAFPVRWTGNAKIRRVCGARTRTYKQRPRKRRRVRPVLSEKCYGLVDAIDLAYNEPIKRMNPPKLNPKQNLQIYKSNIYVYLIH